MPSAIQKKDQQNDRDRHAEKPEQQTTSHDAILSFVAPATAENLGGKSGERTFSPPFAGQQVRRASGPFGLTTPAGWSGSRRPDKFWRRHRRGTLPRSPRCGRAVVEFQRVLLGARLSCACAGRRRVRFQWRSDFGRRRANTFRRLADALRSLDDRAIVALSWMRVGTRTRAARLQAEARVSRCQSRARNGQKLQHGHTSARSARAQ